MKFIQNLLKMNCMKQIKLLLNILMIFGVLDLLDMIDYKTKNNNDFRYILVVIDNFSKFGWTNSIKEIKMHKQYTDEFSKIINNFKKRKPNLIETDDRENEFVNSNILMIF